jgi:hypothetical protein
MATWRAAFSKTLEALEKQGLGSLIRSFEFELQFQQLRLDLRWFPVFLKMQNCPRRLLELAEFEFLRSQVYTNEMGRPRLEPGLLALNPSAQFLEVHEPLPEIGRGPGLYCLVKEGGRFFEMELSLAQALLLDLLREDRKYSPEQLLQQAELHEVKLGLTREEWQRTLSSLIERGVIISGQEMARQAFN